MLMTFLYFGFFLFFMTQGFLDATCFFNHFSHFSAVFAHFELI